MFLTRERAMGKLWIAGRFLACALTALVIVAQPTESRADALEWLTDLITAEPDTDVAALSSEDLPPNAIVTKPDEKRVLRLGRDVLELYPSTVVTLEESGPNTTVRLITGTVRAKVAKRTKGNTFDVRTLMLVATVKGTEFEVSATGKASAVSVYEGRVAVKAAARVGGVDVTPGKTATVTGAADTPALGATPAGGAAAAAKALARASKAGSTSGGSGDDDGGRSDNKDVSTASRGAPNKAAGSGSSGGSGSGGDGGQDGEGDGEGEGGEDGEGAEGGESSDDD